MKKNEPNPKVADVKLEPVLENLNGNLSNESYCACNFCGKVIYLGGEFTNLVESLSGAYYHCPFCIRNGFNTKKNRDVLVLSFRAILGYYYYSLFVKSYNQSIWISEIKDIIDYHEKAGLLNPVFIYDPETFLWFVDFSKVGKGKKQILVDDVLKTISNILLCFNLENYIIGFKTSVLYEKYSKAILKWYQHRKRPEDKMILCPTLAGCSSLIHTKNLEGTKDIELTRDFLPVDLKPVR